MKQYSQEELSRLLSEYLDGSLGAAEQRGLEEYLSAHPEAAKELRELRQIKHLLAAKKKVQPDPFFWSRLSARMESDAEEERNLLPFPRKYVPLASAMAILAFIAVSITVFLQREPILEYMSKQSQVVKEAYVGGILKGAVLPLFANLDNDNVLQYALFGTLPLDARAETALRVDEQSEQGYHIEVGMTADRLPPSVTVKELYSEVLPTRQQRLQIDSVLDEAKLQIARGAFYSENNVLAVDPQLTKLNRMVLSDIAAVLAPLQRERFDRFLNKRNSSYALAKENIPTPEAPRRLRPVFPEPPNLHEFVVITADSTVVTRLRLNIDSLVRRERINVPMAASELPARLENLMKARYERTAAARMRRSEPQPTLRTTGEEDFFKVEITPRFFPDPESMRVWVTPRLKKEKMFRFEFRVESGGVNVQSERGAVSSVDVQLDFSGMDSLMRILTEEQLKHNEQFRKADSVFRARARDYEQPRRARKADTTGRE
jgi:hypothetical protein